VVKTFKVGGVAQVVEHLQRKHEAPSSNPSTAKKKKQTNNNKKPQNLSYLEG
jgi:hypothetical protein